MNNIKVIEKKGNSVGKTVVILAGVHGNELCGVKAFDKLIQDVKIKSGKVIFIYCNLKAIKENKRFIETNLNRCFLNGQPQEMIDTLEGKTAREILPFLEEADVLLDIHASNTENSQPFIICNEKNVKNSKIFNLKIIVYGITKFERGTSGSFMDKQNKPWFAIECGYLEDANSEFVAEENINRFLTHFGFINGKLKHSTNQKIFRVVDLYKNNFGSFRLSRNFKDFEEIKEKTLIGLDGDKEVYVNSGNVVLFVRDRENIGEECFLICEEM